MESQPISESKSFFAVNSLPVASLNTIKGISARSR